MPGWIGPVVAISLLVIALSYVTVGVVVVLAAKAIMSHTKGISEEVAKLRAEVSPVLAAISRVGEKGANVVEMVEAEAEEIVATSRQIREDLEQGFERAKLRLADFDATVGVVQEEIDATVVEVSGVLETARAGAGMIGQLRRVIRPRRRGAS